jgi:hypothetical protein
MRPDYISMTDANIQECMSFYEHLKIHIRHSGIFLSPIGPYDNLYMSNLFPFFRMHEISHQTHTIIAHIIVEKNKFI